MRALRSVSGILATASSAGCPSSLDCCQDSGDFAAADAKVSAKLTNSCCRRSKSCKATTRSRSGRAVRNAVSSVTRAVVLSSLRIVSCSSVAMTLRNFLTLSSPGVARFGVAGFGIARSEVIRLDVTRLDGTRLDGTRLGGVSVKTISPSPARFLPQNVGRKRLDQIVVGAGLRRLDHQFAVAAAGQQDERHLARCRMAPYRTQQRKSVH